LYEGIEPVSPRSVPNRGSSNPPSDAASQGEENTEASAAPAKENSAAPAATASKAPILPPLGLDGYCVVALHDYNKKVAEAQEAGGKPDPSWQGWVKGNKKFGAIHRGRLYLFGSPDSQKTFLADPDRYAPALSGYDPVVFNETQKLVDGKRSIGLCYNGQVFCFASEASLQKFMSSPKPFAETVYQAMLRSDKASKTR
jgi:YHS domain-containing protein